MGSALFLQRILLEVGQQNQQNMQNQLRAQEAQGQQRVQEAQSVPKLQKACHGQIFLERVFSNSNDILTNHQLVGLHFLHAERSRNIEKETGRNHLSLFLFRK